MKHEDELLRLEIISCQWEKKTKAIVGDIHADTGFVEVGLVPAGFGVCYNLSTLQAMDLCKCLCF